MRLALLGNKLDGRFLKKKKGSDTKLKIVMKKMQYSVHYQMKSIKVYLWASLKYIIINQDQLKEIY